MEVVKGSCSWAFVVLLGLMVVAVCQLRMVHGADLSPSQCKEERQLGINACKAVVFGQPASPACCQRIRVSHFECACPVFDAKLAALIDVKKATKLLTDCGRKVPRHFKCGSLYFP
uniref:Bifunctional inhibitor/plant lipid transfer protein/seed storage helical domain-containing protein n=1 Tax=Davidia involucrata TaxID=16924 RepID=A0A5B7BKP6_DAVIN